MMFRGLRLRLTLLYTLAAMALLGLVGAGAYFVVARYFWRVTDLALQHKMVHELHAINAPIPIDLQPADRDWSLIRGELDWLPPDRRPKKDEDDEDKHDDKEGAHASASPTSVPASLDAAELASIYVLPLDERGRVLFDTNLTIQPDYEAIQAALDYGSDLRTVIAANGRSYRLLSYRVSPRYGPTILQLGRELSDQQSVLSQLLIGLSGLGALSTLLVGTASWWLAGRALQPAQQAWERQQRFIASASHELRTPLTLMRASAEVALRGVTKTDPDQHMLLQDILDENDHMRRLVDDLLTLSRLDNAGLTLKLIAVELQPFLTEIQRQIARLADERSIHLELGFVQGQVQADSERLRQVLLIILDNALRHTPAGGTIRISTIPQNTMVQIQVSDTGIGIAPEHLPHIFERFYRVDAARNRENGNAGLGLSIAKALITTMGGQISAQSEMGKGTSMSISLPTSSHKTSNPS